MNRDCNGDFFVADGKEYYACFWDGALITSPPGNGEECPHCKRKIDARSQGACEVVTVKFALVPGRGRIELSA